MKQFAEQEIDKIKNSYIHNPNLMLSQYGNEKEKISEYNGRQILEMLQNADDEAELANKKIIYIFVSEEKLIIANNGLPFSRDGIVSLMYPHLSSKSRRKNKIGHKGTGFRSILSWAESVYIKSYDLSIEFSRNNAIEFLNEIISESPSVNDFIIKQEEPYPIATLVAPKWIVNRPIIVDENIQNMQFDTYIVLDLKKGVYDNIVTQLDKLDIEDLLFMQNTHQLVLQTNEKQILMEKKILLEDTNTINITGEELLLTNQKVDVSKYENGEKIKGKQWSVHGRKGEYNNKEYEIKVAYTDNFDDDGDVLYSFFRTNVQLSFPAVIHGTFELNGNRNQFNDSPNNKHLMGVLIDVLIDTAKLITFNQTKSSWDAIKLLSFDGKLDKNLENMGFKKKLIEKIKENKLFPTVSDQYISYLEKPVFYGLKEAEYLPKEISANLTKFTDDDQVRNMLKQINMFTYMYGPLCNNLKSINSKLDNNIRAKLIRFMFECYKDNIQESRPPLFVDQNNNIIPEKNEIFLPLDEMSIIVPEFISLTFMSKSLYKALLSAFNVSNVNGLYNCIQIFNVHEYKPVTVIRKIVNQTREIIHDLDRHKSKYIKLLLNSLFNIYISAKKTGERFPNDLSVPILNRHNQVVESNQIYFGKEYFETITENLFKPIKKNCFVGSPKILGLETVDKAEVKRFLSWTGIEVFPRSILLPVREKDYEKYVYEAIENYPVKFGDLNVEFGSPNDVMNYQTERAHITAEIVDSFDQILEKSSFEDIIIWLIKCKPIYELVTSGIEKNSRASFQLKFKYRSERKPLPGKYFKSFLLWKLQNSNWVINEKNQRLLPRNFCFTKIIHKSLSPFIESPNIDVNSDKFISNGISAEDVEKLLHSIGIGSDLSTFSTETIYGILDDLEELDPKGEKAEIIYKMIIDSRPKIKKESIFYSAFHADGKVFSRKGTQSQYSSVKDTYFIPNRMYCDDILKNYNIIALDRRLSKQRVKDVYGVNYFEGIKYNLLSEPIYHSLNDDFQLEFEELKPYFYVSRINRDKKHNELEKLKKLKVMLCTEIVTSFIHKRVETALVLNDYDFIIIDNTIMFKLSEGRHHSVDDLRYDARFKADFTELIANILDCEDSRGFFREMYYQRRLDRDDLIAQEFQDENLELLLRSKNLLGSATSPIKNFWMAVIKAKKIKIREDIPYHEEEFKVFCKNILKLDSNVIESILDYDEINSYSNFQSLKRLFQILHLKISVFNLFTLNKINLIDYYKKEFNNCKLNYRQEFLTLLYLQIKQFKEPAEKKRYIKLQLDYENMEFSSYENSFDFNVLKIFKLTIKEKFQIDLSEASSIDLSKIYHENFTQLETLIQKEYYVTTQQIIDFLSNNEFKSLLYFDEVDYLLTEFKKTHVGFLRSNFESPEGGPDGRSKPGYNDPFQNLYSKIIRDFAGVPLPIKDISSKKPESDISSKLKKNVKRSVGRSIARSNEEIGFMGEVIAYLALINEYGEDNVEWVSENALRAKNNETGSETFHYDLRYKDKNGVYRFVEVKASTKEEMTFNITKDEVLFGEEHKDLYEVVIINNVNDEEPDILRLQSIFRYKKHESFKENSKFRVENNSFKIKFLQALN
ncbi:hypothetical protein QFZ81_000086 [Paenibacillus sp. V4I9]|uniref:DUF3883 domain-containing protein n=1 Tax=Paenibacillus sp. V4I9 TaxID=3042308 RepID=UPI0027879D9B|nr:DUF3883 domain-containing protein [Paenibacillus sp. V4I9]MDQ0884998.1 hypothetical protein [Paenibacillus sp. V4I9]